MPTINKHEQSRRKDLRALKTKKLATKSVEDEQGHVRLIPDTDSVEYWNEQLRREGLGMSESSQASGPGDPHNLLVYWGTPQTATEAAERLQLEKASRKKPPGHGPDDGMGRTPRLTYP
jgi:hypothetical protein